MKLTLDDNSINDLVRESMAETIKLAKHAHYTDVRIRINGRDVNRQADWIKYLEIDAPARR